MKGIPYRLSKYMEDVLQEDIISNNVSNTYAEDSEIIEVVDTDKPDDMLSYVKRKAVVGVGETGLPITLNGVTYISLQKALETHNISRNHHQNALRIFKNLLNPSVFESLPKDLVINTILTHYKKLDVALDMSLDTRLWGYRETSEGLEYLCNFKDIQKYIYGFSTYTMCSTAIEKYKMLKGDNIYKVNLYDFYMVLAKTSRYVYGVYADNPDGIPSLITTRHLDKSDDIIAYTGELTLRHKKELQSTYIILTNLSQDIKRVCETLHKKSNIPVGKLGSEGNKVTDKVMDEAVIQTELSEVDVMHKYIVETSGSNVSLAENDEVRQQLQKVLDIIEKQPEEIQSNITRVEENKGVDKPSRNVIKPPKVKEVYEKVTSEDLTTSLSQPVRVRGIADIKKEKHHFGEFQEILKNTHIEDRLELLYTLLTKHEKKINFLADIKHGIPVLEDFDNTNKPKASQELVNNLFNMTLNVNYLPYANRFLGYIDIFRHTSGISYTDMLQANSKGYIPYEGKLYKDINTLFDAYGITKEHSSMFRLLEPCDVPLHISILMDYRLNSYKMKYDITLEGKVYKTLNDYAQDIWEEGDNRVTIPHIDSYVLGLLTEEDITRGIKKLLRATTGKTEEHLPSNSDKYVNDSLYQFFYTEMKDCIQEGLLRDNRKIKEVMKNENILAVISDYFRKINLPYSDNLTKQPVVYTVQDGYISDGRRYGTALGVTPLTVFTGYIDKVKATNLDTKKNPVVKKVDVLNSLIQHNLEDKLYLNIAEKRWKVIATGYINTKENIPYYTVMDNLETTIDLQRLQNQADKDLLEVYYIVYTIREYLEDYFKVLNR